MKAAETSAAASEKPVRMVEVIGRVGRELETLIHATNQLQNATVQLVIAADPKQRSQVMREVQALDSLAQNLNGLAVFLSGLARDMPQDWAIDPAAAARAVTLSSLRRRLGAETGNAGQPVDHGTMREEVLFAS
jgi:hypothetical protein